MKKTVFISNEDNGMKSTIINLILEQKQGIWFYETIKIFNKQNIIANVWVIYEKLKANLDFAKYVPW